MYPPQRFHLRALWVVTRPPRPGYPASLNRELGNALPCSCPERGLRESIKGSARPRQSTSNLGVSTASKTIFRRSSRRKDQTSTPKPLSSSITQNLSKITMQFPSLARSLAWAIMALPALTLAMPHEDLELISRSVQDAELLEARAGCNVAGCIG
jgi:hypothetical protein